jgi:alkanesulfonate monooxygenase SsuD/methylene tetrahydromethanopterin reductase-like flavin-dependent oxidoreductase (luciferase family)
MSLQFFGSPETVRRRLQTYIDLGFNKFVVTTNTPDIPRALRHQWLARFAREVMPEFAGRSPDLPVSAKLQRVARS